MKNADLVALNQNMINVLTEKTVIDWGDISSALSEFKKNSPGFSNYSKEEFDDIVKNGVAFVTYDFGIDGVSIEIAKYARSFESIFPEIPLHFIGGDFYDKADIVLDDSWKRFKIEGMNGWSKWYDGEWFAKLYYEEMPSGSDISDTVAQDIWKQAVEFSTKLGTYLADNNINFIIPVNIPTNPGNLAIMLALVMVSESMGLFVLSSNHDFYWEGGAPEAEKQPNEPTGPRDHFFKNIDNKPFFDLFKSIYPWNGKRWIQVNINTPQSEALVSRFGFSADRVFELGTSISEKFFEEYTEDDVRMVRKRMAYILSDGLPIISPIDVKDHLKNIESWMNNQKPIVCGICDGLTLDPAKNKTVYCLQPTRIIARKRIDWDLKLLKRLMNFPKFKEEFVKDPEYQLVFHITGPVPIEHQEDLETVLNGFVELCDAVPDQVAKRFFIAFSVGNEDHPSLKPNNLEPLCIEEIYRLATVILFPSETEGRGLPIIESSACGIPIVCSRYYPEDVFAEVVGEDLAEKEQIEYILFPDLTERDFSRNFLDMVTDLLLHQDKYADLKDHNKKAVHYRYSVEMIKRKFLELIEALRNSK